MAVWTFNTMTWSNWGVNLWNSISKWLTEWENLAQVKKQDSTKDYFEKRQKITNDITTWKITSWNKAQDTMTVRKNNVVQAFSAYALKNWANPEKVKEFSKNPDWVIKRLTAQWWQKAQAIEDYLMKWGYAERAVNYAVGESNSPYDKTYEEKNLLEKWLDKAKKTTVWNFINTAVSVPLQSVVWLGKMAGNAVSSIFGIDDEEKENKQIEQFKKLSTKWYNDYKKDNKLVNSYDAYSYKNYDDAVKNWFDWSVEDYVDYKIREKEWVKWLSEATSKYLESNVYDTDKDSYGIWKFWGELLELAMLPAAKLKYATKAPKVLEYLWKFWEYLGKWADTVIDASKAVSTKLPKTSKFIWKTKDAVWEWIELQALDDAYEWELSPTEKYWVSSVLNAATRWMLDWLWKSLRFALWPTWVAQNAIWTKSAKEWNEMTDIVNKSRVDQNAERTPMKEIANKLTEARSKIRGKRIESWKELEEVRKWLTYWDSEYTARDVIKDIQDAFAWLKDKGWGENAQIPEFSISKSWRTLNIKNANTLNTVTKWENRQIKLWDELKRVWKEMFNTADKEINASNTEEFIRKVKGILKDEWWNWVSWDGLRTMREVLDVIDEKFSNSLSKKSQTALKEASSKSQKDINLNKAYENLVWRLDWRNTVEAVWAAEKAAWWDAARRELFRIIKEETWIDMNNEIWAWIANLSQFSAADAKKLADMIYPSAPWLYEFILKNGLWWGRRLVTPSYTKDFADKTARWNINKYLQKWVNVAGNAAWLSYSD